MRGVVAQLEQQLGPITSGPTPLEGGITNRNFRVSFAGRDCVVRLPGKDTGLLGISREAERIANSRAAVIGLAPALVYGDDRCLVTDYVQWPPAEAETISRAPEPVGAALRAFHDSGTELPIRFWVPDLLDAYAGVVLDRGGSLPDAYDTARQVVARIARALPLSEPVPCHDDLLPANVLLGEDGQVMLVDWEYAGMGHRLFDLGNLAVNCSLPEDGERRLLDAYLGFPADRAAVAALQLMRVVSDAREAAWGVVQSVISEIDFDFVAYARRHFERLSAAIRDPGFEHALDLARAEMPHA
jgi:aminoglycoside phosphotransferase (APT) family kinase protein